METIAVASLKARLSSYLKKVKAGQEVLITERGVPIARIVPLSETTGAPRLETLARAGLIRPGRGLVRKTLLKPPHGSPADGAGVLAALLADRNESR